MMNNFNVPQSGQQRQQQTPQQGTQVPQPESQAPQDNLKQAMIQQMIRMGLSPEEAQNMFQRMIEQGMTVEAMQNMMKNPGAMQQMMKNMGGMMEQQQEFTKFAQMKKLDTAANNAMGNDLMHKGR
jgi:hypothetical protein